MVEQVVAFDMDGVLAVKPVLTGPAWGKLNGEQRKARKQTLLEHYMAAAPLLRPSGQFHVITARKSEVEVVEVTLSWLKRHYPDQVTQVHFLSEARTIVNVVSFKKRVLDKIGANEFTEDNRAVLRGLAAAGTSAHLWFWKEGMAEPVEFEKEK